VPKIDPAPLSDPDLMLDELWERGERPDICQFLASWQGRGLELDQLLDALRVDQRRRWRSGQRVALDSYLRDFPCLNEDREALFELVYNELAIREDLGEQPDASQYATSYPDLADRLRLQLEVHQALCDDDFMRDQGSEPEPSHLPFGIVSGFEILSEIGRGGMGVVYQARQLKPNRLVALKMILDGHFASAQDLLRFQNEAEVVAALEHPSIVPILEVGQHNGLHYFTMPLLTGGSLASALPRPFDDPRGAARMVAQVTCAVHHAHQRGILHRDLKPANILLDAEGRPHVSDFGLAKRLRDGRGLTESGAIMGSPGYMSPEQAAGDAVAITTASDVYGLGAILYALLTGRAPFEGSSFQETVARLYDEPPDPPSRSNKLVPRPLDQICLKCLEKDPGKRYASAQALATDLDRWLAGEPVSARSEPLSERTRRWMRRRRTAVAACGAAMVMAMLGMAAVLGVQVKSNRELSAAKDREQARFDLAMEAIRAFHTGVSEDLLLKEPQFQRLRTRLLHGAREFFGKLERQLEGQTDRRSRRAMVQAYDELAALTDKIGSKTEALELYRRVLVLRRELARETQPGTAADVEVARCHLVLGQLEYETGHADRAVVAYEEAQSLLEGVNRPSDRTLDFRADLATCEHRIGDALAAMGFSTKAMLKYQTGRSIRESLDRERTVTDSRSSLAESDLAIGNLLWQTGQPADAVTSFEKARARFESLAREQPNSSEYRRGLAHCYNAMSYPLHEMGKTDEALEAFEAARAILETLVRDNPAVTEFRQALAFCDTQIGTLLFDTGRTAEALAPFQRARASLQALFEANPEVDEIANDLARAHSQLGQILDAIGKPVEALASLKKARALREVLTGDDHVLVATYRSDLAVTLGHIGAHERRASRLGEARAAYRQGIALLDGLTTRTPEDEYNLACYHSRIAELAGRAGSGVLAHERQIESDRAMARLQQAVSAGFHVLPLISTDHDLDAIRGRPDFQLLMMDLAFPRYPFTPPER
jgi:serine/threonine-protein kinase